MGPRPRASRKVAVESQGRLAWVSQHTSDPLVEAAPPPQVEAAPGFDFDRFSWLIQRFWTGRVLTADELAELDRLNRSHAANVWEMTANNDKEIECPQTNGT